MITITTADEDEYRALILALSTGPDALADVLSTLVTEIRLEGSPKAARHTPAQLQPARPGRHRQQAIRDLAADVRRGALG